jgi:FAD:protein FMN transferase
MKAIGFGFQALGSACSLQLFADSQDFASMAIEAVVAEVARIERRYSRYRDDSFLSEINRAAAAGVPITLDEETSGLIDYAFSAYRLGEGLFDITCGILREVWDFRSLQIPEAQDVAHVLPRIGMDKLIWERPHLSFAVPGMEIDLGGAWQGIRGGSGGRHPCGLWYRIGADQLRRRSACASRTARCKRLDGGHPRPESGEQSRPGRA